MSFPYNLNVTSDLFDVKDFAVTKLAANITNIDMQFQVDVGSKLPAGRSVILLGGSELIIASQCVANIVYVELRGAFGTVARNWGLGSAVTATMSANHYELVRDGILALQQNVWYYQSPVLDIVTDPSTLTPIKDDAYVVGVGAVGTWANKDRSIARWTGSVWSHIDPTVGMTVYVNGVGRYTYNGSTWVKELDYSAISDMVTLDSTGHIDKQIVPEEINSVCINGNLSTLTDVNSIAASGSILANNIANNSIVVFEPNVDIAAMLPTGTDLRASAASTVANGAMFKWVAINNTDTFGVLLQDNIDHTIVGNAVILPKTSATLGTRLTSGSVWVTYRLA